MSQKTTINEDALKYVLSMPNGRKVLWDILAVSGLFRQPRVAGDTEGTAFNCGSLNVGLVIYADCLAVAPDLTAMMTKEQAANENAAAEVPEKPRGRNRVDPSGTEQPSSDAAFAGDAFALPFARYPTDTGGD